VREIWWFLCGGWSRDRKKESATGALVHVINLVVSLSSSAGSSFMQILD